MKLKITCSFLLFLFLGINLQGQERFNVDFETFQLENGLKVIMHQDFSDPVVAVALTAHVGSAREKEGRTGFAHLFEHLLFLESENLGKGGLDKLSARIGGSGANGSTSRDRTNYFQTVPMDALEKMIWAEADKLGYFINTVTQPVLEKEKQVVKNEKRQGVDNRPYGHTFYVIDKNLYPEGHPYNWQVIGSLEDLQNATLQDVKDFYNRWYVPNNVILTISGNFDKEQAKDWVHKYFDEIPEGQKVERMEKQLVELPSTKKLYHEDNFAKLPELTMAWPSVYSYHEDSYALEILSSYLADGKTAPLYKKLVEDEKLTGSVQMFNYTSELAGQLMVQVRAFDGKDLDSVEMAIEQVFSEFEKEGIPEKDLKRIKAGLESNFYGSVSSVLGKGFQLAQYDIFANDPNFINKEIDKLLAVSGDDVLRVFKKYLSGKNYVATSFVPKGQVELALENSEKAEVVEEEIKEGAEQEFDLSEDADYERTASSFDRTKEPPYYGKPEITTPNVWNETLPSGMRILGITNDEVPLVEFELLIKGGQLLETKENAGISSIITSLLTKGTKTKTPAELEEELELLGASVRMGSSQEYFILRGNTLAKNFDRTMELVSEIMLQPRWDENEFQLIKQQTLSRLQQEKGEPNSIAALEFKKLAYGENSILSMNQLGTKETVESLSMSDLQEFYKENFSPAYTKFLVAGDIEKDAAAKALKALSAQWPPKNVDFPEVPEFTAPEESKIYFYDVPGAKQSVLYFGAPALAATNQDAYSAEVMNYRLGGGSFASRLTQELREGKGYTYGIRSGFSDNEFIGPFTITSGVRSNVTYEATDLVIDILKNYADTFGAEDLDVTKSFMIKSNARKFETLGAKLNILEDMARFGFDADYVKQREQTVTNMSVMDVQELARKYVDADKMYYVIVGDAATQMGKLKELGYGEPVLLNNSQEEE